MKYAVVEVLIIERECTRSDELQAVLQEGKMTGNRIRSKALKEHRIVYIKRWSAIHFGRKPHMLSQCPLCPLDVTYMQDGSVHIMSKEEFTFCYLCVLKMSVVYR